MCWWSTWGKAMACLHLVLVPICYLGDKRSMEALKASSKKARLLHDLQSLTWS
jgi:hypothetical protein